MPSAVFCLQEELLVPDNQGGVGWGREVGENIA